MHVPGNLSYKWNIGLKTHNLLTEEKLLFCEGVCWDNSLHLQVEEEEGKIKIPCIIPQVDFILHVLEIEYQPEVMCKAEGELIWYLVLKELVEEIPELKTL